jgi:RHH-type proline utilization regulon transcriptional repressor/proline dehydrogenase/delta 1-pyrroline-5-carboxylate dehydrogenase
LNVNVLGEAVLGEDEAEHRLQRLIQVLAQPAVDYLSVKVSSICSQLDVLAFDEEVDRIASRLGRLYDAAGGHRPAKFINLDMEEHRDLDLTIAVFERVLDEARHSHLGAGIVLQAYLPDSLPAMEELCKWARARHERAGGQIKVRIVKGANMAMERVDAELHGWPDAPFENKSETDANYKRMLDVALQPDNDPAVRVGVASHNLFEISWAAVLASELDALHRVEFEMLEGMSPALAEAVAARLGGLLVYEPIVEPHELDSAIAYLVRRLDENSAPENFIAHQFAMTVGSPAWEEQARRFRESVHDRHLRPERSRRTQDRTHDQDPMEHGSAFVNEPDTDFTVGPNRRWALRSLQDAAASKTAEYHPVVTGQVVAGQVVAETGWEWGTDPSRPTTPGYRWVSASTEVIEAAIAAAKSGQADWCQRPAGDRRAILRGAAESLSRSRSRLLTVMALDTGKTVREGDPEVSEAIDFANYYSRHIPEDGAFRPWGSVVVASPWNFPLSISAGGVLGALAAGNTVVLKPAPEAVAVAGELVEALWKGGVPRTALQYVPCVDGDASRLLITSRDVDAVVLTGSWETAREFLRWRPDLRLHAETSGKNAIVVTATADPDQAIADLLHSAFGHAGQKCSAASLAIVEAGVYDDGRFLRRLADATRSLRPGPAWLASTTMGPLIRPPEGPLRRALSRLDPGERWLVEPRPLDEHQYLWSPGVKVGVDPGSFFHMTECFGPVLGVMRAQDLAQAVEWQNQPPYGLTAGLQALDPAEIDWWRDRVQAGNLYVNRGITGAIVGRQPFGGWKRSVVGSGAKAGGPNYVASLGSWEEAGYKRTDLRQFAAACQAAWREMKRPIDTAGLAAESNVLRYRPLSQVILCCGPEAAEGDVERALAASAAVGAAVTVADHVCSGSGTAPLPDKVRFLGAVPSHVRAAAVESGTWVDDTPVSANPNRELLRWVREQAVSESRHRHGDITDRRPGLA